MTGLEEQKLAERLGYVDKPARPNAFFPSGYWKKAVAKSVEDSLDAEFRA